MGLWLDWSIAVFYSLPQLLLQRCNLQLPHQHDQISFSFHLYHQTLTLIWPFRHGFQYWHDLLWTNKYFCWHLFLLRPLCLFVFLFCLHFCILSHVEIIRCMVKSLVATSMYFFSFEILLKKENLKSIFWTREFGHPSLYTSLPNGLNMPLFWCITCHSSLPHCRNFAALLLAHYSFLLEKLLNENGSWMDCFTL